MPEANLLKPIRQKLAIFVAGNLRGLLRENDVSLDVTICNVNYNLEYQKHEKKILHLRFKNVSIDAIYRYCHSLVYLTSCLRI